ncbi:MAG: hypothetical protein J6A08_02585 [Lachnospiraceae bacterium]|nr:hypothetical protein [Lachnospiraceae bacterium]
MKWWKRTVKSMSRPAKLKRWQDRYDKAKTLYADELNLMDAYERYYNGDRHVKGNPNSSAPAKKLAINVRNIVYELIESQVDSSIPMPKVSAVHAEDAGKAKIIEEFLKNEMKTLRFKALNDKQERITPIQGGDFILVEWDNSKGYHCTLGDLAVSEVHPRQVIPQPGVTDIERMDYLFIRTSQTKEYVKRKYGVDVSEEEETDAELREEASAEDIVTVVTAYYRNAHGGIGLYRWCGDTELEDMADYQARQIEVCEACGTVKTREVCPECGGRKYITRKQETELIPVNQAVGADPISGETIYESIEVEVPYYTPDRFPLVLRKNISRDRYLLGFSDVGVIEDQQDTIKKLGSKINEKLLKGGSYVTLPAGLGIDTTDEECKIIRIESPNQISMIQSITVQADTSQDRALLETNYSWAKSALGITDSFQGKYDSSATSGTAKQYSINQAAGRLESKRVMKNLAYAELYEMMFKFALAYADQKIPVSMQGKDGEQSFIHFDRRDFLKMDDAGEWYWNDEFIFDTDPTSTLLTNREAMWNQADMKLQSGAFGPLGDLETNYLYWLEQERNGYPNAGEIKRVIESRLAEQKQQEQMMQEQMAMQQGGGQNEMSLM